MERGHGAGNEGRTSALRWSIELEDRGVVIWPLVPGSGAACLLWLGAFSLAASSKEAIQFTHSPTSACTLLRPFLAGATTTSGTTSISPQNLYAPVTALLSSTQLPHLTCEEAPYSLGQGPYRDKNSQIMSAPVAGLPAPPALEKKPVKFSNLLRESTAGELLSERIWS